jgi:hypothetical protein
VPCRSDRSLCLVCSSHLVLPMLQICQLMEPLTSGASSFIVSLSPTGCIGRGLGGQPDAATGTLQ